MACEVLLKVVLCALALVLPTLQGVQVRGVPPGLVSRFDAQLGSRLKQLNSTSEAEFTLRNWLRANGYYNVTIIPSKDHQTLALKAGLPMLLTAPQVRVKGALSQHLACQQLLLEASKQEGLRVDHTQYERFKASLLTLAQQQGHLDARFTEHRLMVDPVLGQGTWCLTLDSGKQYLFGEVHFSQSPIDPDRLSAVTAPFVGTPYSAQRLEALTQKLLQTGWFDQVFAAPTLGALDVPVWVTGVPKPWMRVEAGLAYSEEKHLCIKVNGLWPYVTSRGDTFEGAVEKSFLTSQWGGSVRYRYPCVSDPSHAYFQGEGRFTLGEASSPFQRPDFSLTLLRSFSPTWAWRSCVCGGSGGSYRSTCFASPEFCPAFYAHLHTIFALTRGLIPFELESEWQGGVQPFFVKGLFSARCTVPVASSSELRLRLSVGQLYRGSGSFPHFLLFFASGDKGVRGEVSRCSAERCRGADQLGVVSAQLHFRAKGPWGGFIFVDSGAAFDRGALAAWNQCRGTGVGFGVEFRNASQFFSVALATPGSLPWTRMPSLSFQWGFA